jgi:hypothetical protein
MKVRSRTPVYGRLQMQATLDLRFESPPELAAFRSRLEPAGSDRFADVFALIGVDGTGGPIRVILATENSSWAADMPRWTAGYAIGSAGTIVIFPTRTPSYPHASIENVLRHEVAHILIDRAAGGRSVPRWFHEGLALAAERDLGFGDRTRLFYELMLGRRTGLGDIDRLFSGDRGSQDRAYVLSGVFVDGLLREHGADSAAQILRQMRNGIGFEAAFADVTGRNLRQAEAEFWSKNRVWTTWLPIVSSSPVLWMLVTLIALLAIRRRRQKDAELRKKFEDEERSIPPLDEM